MKVDIILKTFAFIHNVIWSIIGVLILISIVLFLKSGYKNSLMPQASPSGSASGTNSNMLQLSDTDLKCIQDVLGKARFDQIASGSGGTPSPDEQVKLEKCFPASK